MRKHPLISYPLGNICNERNSISAVMGNGNLNTQTHLCSSFRDIFPRSCKKSFCWLYALCSRIKGKLLLEKYSMASPILKCLTSTMFEHIIWRIANILDASLYTDEYFWVWEKRVFLKVNFCTSVINLRTDHSKTRFSTAEHMSEKIPQNLNYCHKY